MPDLLSQLYVSSFDGIIFPASDVSESSGLETVEHTPLQGSGGYIETIRRNSKRWTVVIPLFSPLRAGPGEDDFTNLFPVRHLELVQRFDSGEALAYVHPLLGSFWCKGIDYSYSILPNYRNGTILKVTFVEHVETQAAIEVATNAAQTATVEAAAAAKEWSELPDTPEDLMESVSGALDDLEGAARDVQAATEAPGLLADSINNKVDRVQSAAGRVGDSLSKAGNQVANVPDFLGRVDKAKEGAQNAQKKDTKPGREKRFHIVLGRTTLPALSIRLKNTVEELVQLNPTLARTLIVEENVLISYYV